MSPSWANPAPARRRCSTFWRRLTSPPPAASCWTARILQPDQASRLSAAFPRDNLGFVFQEFNLLDTFHGRGQYLSAARPRGQAAIDEMHCTARTPIAARLGITELLKKYPYEMSGGQKQRAAVARALITEPTHDSRRRADRRARFASPPTNCCACSTEINRQRTDHSYGHALRQGGQLAQSRVLFIKRRRGVSIRSIAATTPTSQLYQKISETLTLLATGGERK